jgi:hypothetical protein
MNRTLKRPMFRMGGSTGTGITSGLDQPRQQYSRGTDPYENALALRDRYMQDVDKYRGEQSPFNPMAGPGFLTSFGLNLMSATPRGKGLTGLLATAGESAKEPFKTFQAAKMAERGRKGNIADDIFTSALASEYGIQEAQIKADAEKAKGGTEFERERRADLVGELYDDKILNLTSQLENANPQLQSELQKNIDDLIKDKEDKKLSILTGSMTEDDFIKDIIIAGVKNDIFDPAKVADKYPKLAGLLYDEMADGGRAGYNIGGQAMMPGVANAEEEQVQDLSYNELRSRLPQSISNDVVQVISQSKQALLDFANIRDQQDVEEFNQRYNVSLNIAQEG